jgi:hypothetical protein
MLSKYNINLMYVTPSMNTLGKTMSVLSVYDSIKKNKLVYS